jgi:3D (Asp-Asp-Asp) domain-containing protein
MIFLVTVFIFDLFSAGMANAVVDFGPYISSDHPLVLEIEAMENETKPFGKLPQAGERAKRIMKIPVTAYNSLPEQTDDTPFITASGTQTRWGVVAANFLPIGTRVRFPELYPGQNFYVEDRMNARYNKHADIWMEELADARNFGSQWTTIEVF